MRLLDSHGDLPAEVADRAAYHSSELKLSAAPSGADGF